MTPVAKPTLLAVLGLLPFTGCGTQPQTGSHVQDESTASSSSLTMADAVQAALDLNLPSTSGSHPLLGTVASSGKPCQIWIDSRSGTSPWFAVEMSEIAQELPGGGSVAGQDMHVDLRTDMAYTPVIQTLSRSDRELHLVYKVHSPWGHSDVGTPVPPNDETTSLDIHLAADGSISRIDMGDKVVVALIPVTNRTMTCTVQ